MKLKYIKLFIVSIFCAFNLTPNYAAASTQDPGIPHIINGSLDLRGYPFENGSIIKLTGDWEFYWNQLISPDDFKTQDYRELADYLKLPGMWTSILPGPENYDSYGFATYRLNILMDPEPGELSLSLGIVSTSFNLYINGDLLGYVGHVGKYPQDSDPGYRPAHFNFQSATGQIEIIIQVSNFNFRVGGIWKPILFGPANRVWDSIELSLAIQIFLMGCIFIIAIYHMSLFLIRRKFLSPLIFSLYCIVLTFRTLVTGDIFILRLVDMPWELLVKIEYLTFYIGFPLFSIFLFTLFQEEVSKAFLRVVVTVSIFFSLLVIFTPVRTFSESILVYQIFSLLASVYMFWFLSKAAITGRDGARIFLHGTIILFITMINDILYNNQIISTAQLIPFGVVYFTFCQSLILSKRFFDQFHTVDQQRKMLEFHQFDLEDKVKRRTSELEKANLKLQEISMKDGLTGVANRRRFDEYLFMECRRMNRENHPISLIMCDIDYFKKYNDAYGHQMGDECLIVVAKTLENSTNRVSDLVGRYGGEEFGIVLPNTPLEGAVSLANAMREKISDRKLPHKDSDVSGFVSISLGVSCITQGENYDPKILIEKADVALYQAKRNGRNRVEVELQVKDQNL